MIYPKCEKMPKDFMLSLAAGKTCCWLGEKEIYNRTADGIKE